MLNTLSPSTSEDKTPFSHLILLIICCGDSMSETSQTLALLLTSDNCITNKHADALISKTFEELKLSIFT